MGSKLVGRVFFVSGKNKNQTNFKRQRISSETRQNSGAQKRGAKITLSLFLALTLFAKRHGDVVNYGSEVGLFTASFFVTSFVPKHRLIC